MALHQGMFLSELTWFCPVCLPDFWTFEVDRFDGTAGVGPAKRLSERSVEVIDEVSQSLLKVFVSWFSGNRNFDLNCR